MRRLAVLGLVMLLLPLPGGAQEERDDRGMLTRFLEDNLSGAGREVRVDGFRGALSGRATIERLTIADAEGVWLTLENAVLDWSRAALLSGRVEVNELSAERIALDRLPEPGPAQPPAPEAGVFRLPELPVSVRIGSLAAESLTLGAPVLGEAAVLTLDGALSLAGGEGAARLAGTRTDGREGRVTLDAAFSNATGILSLDLALAEEAGGIAATLLALPGAPPVSLSVTGDGPLDDFGAELSLATEGVDRLSGTLRLTGEPATGTRRFAARIGGDIGPLLAPAYRGFFGADLRLAADGRRRADGGIELDALTLDAAGMTLTGELVLAPGGLPRRFALDARIGGDGATPLRLPLPGPPAEIAEARLTARFDAAAGDSWRAEARLDSLSRGGLSIRAAELRGEGTIRQGGGGRPAAVTAAVTARARGLGHADAALARALGDVLAAGAELSWQDGDPVTLSRLDIGSGNASASAQGTLAAGSGGLAVDGRARVSSADLSRFSGLAGRALTGAAEAELSGRGDWPGGAFDLVMTAEGRDVTLDMPRADTLLAGTARLDVAARRGQDGVTLDRLQVAAPAGAVAAEGRLSSAAGALELAARLEDLAPLAEGLGGPAEASAAIGWQAGGPIRLDRFNASGAGATLTGRGGIDIADPVQPLRFDLLGEVDDLSRFAGLAGRPLGGRLWLAAKGGLELEGRDFDIAIDSATTDLRPGLAQLDPLFSGRGTLALTARRKGSTLEIDRLRAETPQISARASGAPGGPDGLRIEARIADVGRVVPDFAGPLALSGTAREAGADWRVTLDAEGPGGLTASASGRLAADGSDADLDLSGQAPLGLANPFIVPRSVAGMARYDLRLRGAPGLSALSGTVTITGARVAMPTLNTSLAGLEARARLARGRADISASAAVEAGGRIAVAGGLGLAAPFPADLALDFDRVALTDRRLYSTTVDGRIALAGPLGAGGRVSGEIALGATEIRVPSTGLGASGRIPEIRHVNEPAAVRTSRQRAGLIRDDTADGGAPGAGPALDVTVTAANRIFVRGRGLDAEFGGGLRVTGTTGDLVPAGRFELIRGRLDILGRRLNLTEGAIEMRGDLIPDLRIVAESRAEDVTVRITIEGKADAPEITFSSSPPLPEDEVMAQLLFGRGTAQLSAFQALRLASAVAVLAGNSGADVVENLRGAFGLDDFDVSTSAQGGTALRFGKYLSENIYTDFVIDSEGKTEIDLNLDVTPSITVRGSLGASGETDLGVFFERDY